MALFGFNFGSSKETMNLPQIMPLSIRDKDFIQLDCETIYKRILTDVLERTDGLSEDEQDLLWDNCLANEKANGLVSLLAKAMVNRSELFLVYNPGLKILRKAELAEVTQIRADYLEKGESTAGVFISFKEFMQADMMKLYSALEHCGVASFWKSMNLSKALQIKIKELRSSTGFTDSADIKAQAVEIAKALASGLDIYIDADDVLELLKPDLTATTSAMDLIAQKRSFYLGLPASYITGESSKGIGDQGVGDAKKVEQGLKGYFFSIIKPVTKAIFNKSISFTTDDFDLIKSSMDVYKTFTLTDEEYVSKINKQKILNRMMGLPANAKGDPVPETPPVDPNAQPPKPGAPGAIPPPQK